MMSSFGIQSAQHGFHLPENLCLRVTESLFEHIVSMVENAKVRENHVDNAPYDSFVP